MPRYFRVHGLSRDTGRKRNRKIEAWTEDIARERAADLGIVVESIEQLPDEPASDAQRAYAKRVGIDLHSDCTMPHASALLSCHENDIDPPPGLNEQQLYQLIHDKRRTEDLNTCERYATSVIRHDGKFDWLLFRDVPQEYAAAARVIAQEIYEHKTTFEQVEEQDEGFWSFKHEDRAAARGIDTADLDGWYYFGQDGPSTRTKCYRFVKERVNIPSSTHDAHRSTATTKREPRMTNPDPYGLESVKRELAKEQRNDASKKKAANVKSWGVAGTVASAAILLVAILGSDFPTGLRWSVGIVAVISLLISILIAGIGDAMKQ